VSGGGGGGDGLSSFVSLGTASGASAASSGIAGLERGSGVQGETGMNSRASPSFAFVMWILPGNFLEL